MDQLTLSPMERKTPYRLFDGASTLLLIFAFKKNFFASFAGRIMPRHTHDDCYMPSN